MRLRSLAVPVLAVGTLALAAPAGAQDQEPTLSPENEDFLQVPPQAGQASDALRRDRTLFPRSVYDGLSAEEYYWMERDETRWPYDVDPREQQYVPRPEPLLEFDLR